MSRTELFRLAIAEIPDASAAELSLFIQEKYGVRIDPRFIPVLRASPQDLERLTRLRQAARQERLSQVA
jgi:hypothetical protein